MRAYLLTVLAAVVLVAGVAPAHAELTAEERAKLVRYLSETRDQVLAETRSLSEAQWSFQPGPGRWSVGEVVQHLALAEPFLFDLQQKLVSGPAATPEQRKAAEGQDQVVMQVIPDRTKKVNAPEPLQPAGKTGAPEHRAARPTEGGASECRNPASGRSPPDKKS